MQGKYFASIREQLELANIDSQSSKFQSYQKIWSNIEADMAKGGIKSISYKMKKKERGEFRALSQYFHNQLLTHKNHYWAQILKPLIKHLS